jgi:hypothetical protein
MDTTDLHPVESKHIAAVGYDANTRTLTVRFKSGGTYTYHDVPEQLYEEMLDAPSIGQFHSLQIRGRFEHNRLDDPE